jgi:hypothetical protein
MMKKLLVLALVLSMVGLANAGLSLETDYDGRALLPSETVTFKVLATDLMVSTYGNYPYFVVVAMPDAGAITGGVAIVTPQTGDLNMIDNTLVDFFPVTGQAGIGGFVGSSSTTVGYMVQGITIDEIQFHCNGPIDAVVQLWVSGDFATFEMIDSVIVKQIPEPITMVLLGLGGLFLRKKK